MCRFVHDVNLDLHEWERQRNIYINQAQYDDLTLGKATYYLNRTNISGVISGGVIGGQKQNGNYLMDARFNRENLIKRIEEIGRLSGKIDIYNMDVFDFIQPCIMRKYYKVLINFDPPYVEKGGQLYKNSFNEKDHTDLRNAIKRCKRKWIVTYDICELTQRLYCDYRTDFIDINYSVNRSRKAKELIVFSDNLVLPNKELDIKE